VFSLPKPAQVTSVVLFNIGPVTPNRINGLFDSVKETEPHPYFNKHTHSFKTLSLISAGTSSNNGWVGGGRGKGGVCFSSLVKQKKKRTFASLFTSAEKELFFIHDVIVKQKIKKRPTNYYYRPPGHTRMHGGVCTLDT
jgi:hypothetical protein